MRASFIKIVRSKKFILIAILVLISAVLYGLKIDKIKIQPSLNRASVFYNQGLTALEQKNYTKAIANFNKALAINPENIEIYVKKSQAEYMLGEKEAALKTVEAGLKIAPDNELLKGRRDILLKSWLADPSQDMPRQ